MSFDAGTIDVECPECHEPVAIAVSATERRQRHTGDALLIAIGVAQERLSTTLAEHIAEHH
jgi:hypothetical protein